MTDPIQLGDITIRFLVVEDGISIFEVDVAPGAQVPAPHSHDAFEETIYGVIGTSTWTVDGAPVAVAPGDALHIRRGVVHGFVNDADAPTTFLAISTPGHMRPAYFLDVRDALPDRAAVMDAMRRHGLTPAPPPS
jgi:quercetin dioxygenase-like cupin family protein